MTSRPLTVAGVCSGIGGFDLGFLDAGFRVLWTCEKDPQARAVLQARFPDTVHLTDMTSPEVLQQTAPDVLTGGTPCQGFSLAGFRRGLADDRSNLCFQFCEHAKHFSQSLVLWENVPGVLSMHDNAFGCFLAALVGADTPLLPSPCPGPGEPLGKWWRRDKSSGALRPRWPGAGVVAGPLRTAAWRVLDAQYFGVAQRRRRVFVVADTGTGCAPEILFEPESVRRDSPPRRQPRQNLAPTLSARTQGGGGLGTDAELDGALIAHTLRGEGYDASEDGTGRGTPLVVDEVSVPLVGRSQDAHDDSRQTYIPLVTGPLCANGKAAGSATQQDAEQGMLVAEPQVIAFSCKDHGQDASIDLAPCLRAMGHTTSHINGGGQMAIAFNPRERGDDGRGYSRPPLVTGDITGALECVKTPHVAILPFDTTQVTSATNRSAPAVGDPCHTLNAGAHAPAIATFGSDNQLEPEAPVFSIQERAIEENPNAGPDGIGVKSDGLAYTLEARQTSQAVAFNPHVATFQQSSMDGRGTIGFDPHTQVARPVRTQEDHQMLIDPSAYAVRRLTPRECDRLQGFPDDWGLIPYKGKPMADSARYKQNGNAVNRNVARWLAHRIRHALESRHHHP